MTRLWIGVLLLVVGCSHAPDLSQSGPPDPGFTEKTGKADKHAPELTIGSPAPPLKVSRFLKGEPVTKFEPGKIYVVEFWATWCGPCVQAMPHVSALQKQYPAVTFIGVNVFEDDDSAAETFLKQQGDKIGYRIARDEVPAGAKAVDGVMATTWLKAAKENGIPTAFLIDGQGRIAEITHPMSMDDVLPKMLDGSWDIAAAAKRHLEEMAKSHIESEFDEMLRAITDAGFSDQTLAKLDQLAAEVPSRAPLIGMLKFRMLLSADGNSEQALAEGRKLLKLETAVAPEFLNAIAWEVVDPERKQPAAAKLQAFALEAAKLADERSQQKNAAIADTLARALFVTGDAKAAAEVQRRAISLAEMTTGADALVKELKQRLTDYETSIASPAKPE